MIDGNDDMAERMIQEPMIISNLSAYKTTDMIRLAWPPRAVPLHDDN